MPIYEYECPKCGHVFEEWARSSDAHKDAKCPECGADSPRIMSRTSFVLKGNGWYVSDYGYRKGITEECGSGAEAPAKAAPTAPARQGEKSLAKIPEKPASPKAEKSAPAEKPVQKAAAKSDKQEKA